MAPDRHWFLVRRINLPTQPRENPELRLYIWVIVKEAVIVTIIFGGNLFFLSDLNHPVATNSTSVPVIQSTTVKPATDGPDTKTHYPDSGPDTKKLFLCRYRQPSS